MSEQSKREKSTGYSQHIQMGNEGVSAQQKSMEKSAESPILKNAHLQEGLMNSTGDLSASNILAIQILMGDWIKLKQELPASRITSSNGKIYWCIEAIGHHLEILDGKLLVDGQSVDIEKLLESGYEKN